MFAGCLRSYVVVSLTLLAAPMGCNADVVDDTGRPFDFTEIEPEALTDPEPVPQMRDVGTSDGGDCVPWTGTITRDDVELSLLAPNLYLLLDTSGSMGEWENCQDSNVTGCCDDCLTQRCCWESCCDQRTPPFPIDEAKIALDSIANAFAADVRFGIGTFPSPTTLNTWSCGMTERLPMGNHRAVEVRRSYADVQPHGSTPTGASLRLLDENRSLSDPADAHDAQRTKALVLITDGEPTSCEESNPSVEHARALHAQGIDIYVVGFRSAAREETLDAIAAAGGTDNPNDETRRFFVAEDTSELLASLEEISRAILGCTYQVEKPPDEPGAARLFVDGAELDPAEFTYDPAGTLHLSRGICELLEADEEVEVVIGCTSA